MILLLCLPPEVAALSCLLVEMAKRGFIYAKRPRNFKEILLIQKCSTI